MHLDRTDRIEKSPVEGEEDQLMVVLKNKQKTGNSISTDYDPEGADLKVNVEDGMILEHHNVSSFSASHVLWELRRLAKLEHPPKEKIVLWY